MNLIIHVIADENNKSLRKLPPGNKTQELQEQGHHEKNIFEIMIHKTIT